MGMKSVTAQFSQQGTDYHYLVPDGDHPHAGDFIITSVSWDGEYSRYANTATFSFMGSFKIARINEVYENAHYKAQKFYMKLLPHAELVSLKDRNRNLLARERQKLEVRKELEEMSKTYSQLDLFREMAKTDPKAARLLDVMTDGRSGV
jgi:hypothetical protein